MGDMRSKLKLKYARKSYNKQLKPKEPPTLGLRLAKHIHSCPCCAFLGTEYIIYEGHSIWDLYYCYNMDLIIARWGNEKYDTLFEQRDEIMVLYAKVYPLCKGYELAKDLRIWYN